MKIKKAHLILFAFFLITLFENKIKACSMYKITFDGKTMVGCNHDTWFSTPKIWFENAKKPNEFGASFTGARQVGGNRTAPQSGMNEKGLAFSRLVAYYPKKENPFPNRLKIGNEVDYLTDILHKCATVKEVKKYIKQYDHSIFIEDIFIYIDSLGEYLIIEPYQLINGNDPNYVLANFCPSITDNEQARKMERYRNGEDFLKTHNVKSSLEYCTAMSDTMHVCRSRNGDGTLLTSIWDTKDKSVNLYFYHSYDTAVQFSLAEELAKGDRTIDVPSLFPRNLEFERLRSFKTPFNTPVLRILLVAIAGLLSFFIFLLILAAIKGKNTEITFKNTFLMSALNLSLIGYLFVLATNVNIYYFDVPYKHYDSGLISTSSYTPFLLLAVIIPVSLFTIKRLKSVKTKRWIKATLVSNNLIYLILILSFGYWGLYSIWN
jgi:predicted choloylglycine hydrolase